MRRLLLLWILSLLLLGIPRPAFASAEVIDVEMEYRFGEYITFRARVLSVVPVRQISVSLRRDGEAGSQVFPMAAAPNGYFIYTHDMKKYILRPFSRLTFFFEGELENGEKFVSSGYLFRYDDNRFTWKSLKGDVIEVLWYEGDADFGRTALESASAGLAEAARVVPLAQPVETLEVYVYASAEDLQSALFLGGEAWQAGHASPDLGVVMVAIPPGLNQSLLMDQLIPHEIAHVLLYQGLGNNYANLPVWFREGVATLAERFPNPDYEHALAVASQEHSLLPMNELCASFPPDQGRAFLAYAQSASFTRYVRDQYGNMGLLALAIAYSDAINCEQGTVRGLGVPLSQLELEWRQNVLGENTSETMVRNLFPYALVLVVLLILPVMGVLSSPRRKEYVRFV